MVVAAMKMPMPTVNTICSGLRRSFEVPAKTDRPIATTGKSVSGREFNAAST
jgi:hypothetical protein